MHQSDPSIVRVPAHSILDVVRGDFQAISSGLMAEDL